MWIACYFYYDQLEPTKSATDFFSDCSHNKYLSYLSMKIRPSYGWDIPLSHKLKFYAKYLHFKAENGQNLMEKHNFTSVSSNSNMNERLWMTRAHTKRTDANKCCRKNACAAIAPNYALPCVEKWTHIAYRRTVVNHSKNARCCCLWLCAFEFHWIHRAYQKSLKFWWIFFGKIFLRQFYINLSLEY